MRVLGIDPGTAVTGYGVVEEVDRSLKFIASGSITTSSKLPFSERLGKLFQGINELINNFKPDSVAVEEPFLAKNAKMALRIGQARGVAVLAAVQAGLEVASYTPLQVKQAIVGYGRAEKEQMQEMVKRLLGLDEIPRPDHAADALGLAICHLHTMQLSHKCRHD